MAPGPPPGVRLCLGNTAYSTRKRTPPRAGGSVILDVYIAHDGLVWSVPCLAHMTIECRDCPGSGHLGAGVSRVCLP